MAGRYALLASPDVLRARYSYRDEPDFPPRVNIAPTQPVPVIALDRGERRFVLMRWGFIPGFVKDVREFPLILNVRAETVRDKPSFRAAFLRRRCLMPADGFYEWQAVGAAKRPFLIRRPDHAPFAFAAIFETYVGGDGSEIDTVAMVTTGANAALSAIGDRCPVILPSPEAEQAWLDPEARIEEAQRLLVAPADDALELVPIGTGINKATNTNPNLQEPIGSIIRPILSGNTQKRLF